ncbi:uncharacterized protein LOC126690171 [Quercus robur]|uniref:uncharacterized protein LOC126690171 n=1 Tax=Quercus robur TaxID=38942 RepID=UPI002163550A|nr:uncharacterized protein LOC126690171 [Quercus robur]
MDNLAEHWQKLSLNDREDENLELPEENSSNESVKGFEVRRVGDHVLLFVFDNKEEAEKILSNAPWSFDKHLVVLQWYDKEVPIKALEFSKIPIWVQVHDIPMRFLNRKVVEDLCEVVGSVCRVDDVNEMDGGMEGAL